MFAKSSWNGIGTTTAEYGVYDSRRKRLMESHSARLPLVIKADGLCGGKGVLVTTPTEPKPAFRRTA